MARRMKFGTWCKKDPEDTTKIAYTFYTKEWDGTEKVLYFTSEDECSFNMLSRLREAWIDKIERIENEFEDCWNVVLYEGK